MIWIIGILITLAMAFVWLWPTPSPTRSSEVELLTLLLKEVRSMQQAVARLTADVAALTTVNASAIALFSGLAQLVRDNAGDPAALNSLADSIEAQNVALQAAVTANTPAAPAA